MVQNYRPTPHRDKPLADRWLDPVRRLLYSPAAEVRQSVRMSERVRRAGRARGGWAMDRISRREFLALGAGAALTAAVSCTPGSSNGPAKAPPKPSSTGVTVTKPVTITVWDQETGKVKAVWEQLNKSFEQKNPNVTINRVNRSFGDLQSVLKLAIAGPHAPDVVEANQGWPDMGQMVKAGLLLPLDNYADAYDWFDRV